MKLHTTTKRRVYKTKQGYRKRQQLLMLTRIFRSKLHNEIKKKIVYCDENEIVMACLQP